VNLAEVKVDALTSLPKPNPGSTRMVKVKLGFRYFVASR
jgi:hypothetical protein